MPPVFCASAAICNVNVVLPDASGPKISTKQPTVPQLYPATCSTISNLTSAKPARWSAAEVLIT